MLLIKLFSHRNCCEIGAMYFNSIINLNVLLNTSSTILFPIEREMDRRMSNGSKVENL